MHNTSDIHKTFARQLADPRTAWAVTGVAIAVAVASMLFTQSTTTVSSGTLAGLVTIEQVREHLKTTKEQQVAGLNSAQGQFDLTSAIRDSLLTVGTDTLTRQSLLARIAGEREAIVRSIYATEGQIQLAAQIRNKTLLLK